MALALGTVACGVLFARAPDVAEAPAEHLVLADFDGLGLMFGVGLIAFSCHLEAISIEADLARRERFDGVLVRAFVPLILLFVVFGAGGAPSRGEDAGALQASHLDGAARRVEAQQVDPQHAMDHTMTMQAATRAQR